MTRTCTDIAMTNRFACLALILLVLAATALMRPALAADAVPGHVQAVTAALKMRLAGASEAEVEAALGVRGGGAVEPEPGFSYDGFALRRAVYADYSPPSDAAPYHSLAGYLQFADPIDRRATVAFRVFYDMTGEGPAIGFASWQTTTPARPAVEAYFVPAEKMTAGAGANDALAFHDHVTRNALPGFAVEEARNKGAALWVVVFLKDRLEPGVAFELAASGSRTGTGGDATATRYLLDDGWIAAVRADAGGKPGNPARFFKANYTPGASVAEAGRVKTALAVFPTASP
jgi:hypothetical protein